MNSHCFLEVVAVQYVKANLILHVSTKYECFLLNSFDGRVNISLILWDDSGGFINFKSFLNNFVVEIVLKISASRKCI